MSQPNDSFDKRRPNDRCYCVWVVFFLQGIGMNFPWNVYITAVSYFHARLSTTGFKDDFENIFTSTYTLSNLLFMLLVVMNANEAYFHMRGSVVVPQVMTCVLFATTTYLVFFQMNDDYFFWISVGMIGLVGISAALVQSGIFGLAGRFPPIYTQAVMSGQGVAGIIVSITSLSTVLATPCGSGNGNGGGGEEVPTTPLFTPVFTSLTQHSSQNGTSSVKMESFEYFLASTVVVALTVVAFLLLSWSDFGKYYAFSHYVDDENDAEEVKNGNEYGHEDLQAELLHNASDLSILTPKSKARRLVRLRRQSILDSPVFQSDTSPSYGDVVNDEQTPNPLAPMPTCKLIILIGRHCFSVCFVFVVTLSVFPGITSIIRSSHNPNNQRCPSSCSRIPYGGGVWQAAFFLLFNVGDTLGRAMASALDIIPHRWLWVVSICRIGFIPLLLLCNLNPDTANVPTPSSSTSSSLVDSGGGGASSLALGYFTTDIYPISFLCLLALSNGYLASLEMMHTPNLVPKHEASRAGAIMAFFLVMGLLLGSLASFGVRAIAVL